MRYLDELVLVYPGKDPQTQKFFLGQFFDCRPNVFSGRTTALLRGEVEAREAVVRRQSRYVLGQYLPLLTAVKYGLAQRESSLWTAYVEGRSAAHPSQALADEQRAMQQISTLVRGVTHLLGGPIGWARDLMRRGTPTERALASMVLGRFATRSIMEELASQVTGSSLNFAAAYALADRGGQIAGESLVRAARVHGAGRPDLYMVLRGFPGPEALACLRAEESRTSAQGRCNIAGALASHPLPSCRDLLERLIRRREGWVTVWALDAVAHGSGPEALPLIELAWSLESHEFVRVQAVRAAGSVRSPEATAFCLDRLKKGSDRIQLAALEALVQTGLGPDEMARLALPLLRSTYLRAQVHAMIIVALNDPDAIGEPLAQLMVSDDPLQRAESAYVLGYLQGPGSLELLERIAREDPAESVRLQAVKSIARFDQEAAMESVDRLLGSGDLCTVRTAALAAMTLPGSVAPWLQTRLSGYLESAGDPAVRASLLGLSGFVAGCASQTVPGWVTAVLKAGEGDELIGVLDGLKCAGDRAPLDEVTALSNHADPRIRARAAMVAFAGGKLEALDWLSSLSASGGPDDSREALLALLELGCLLPFAAGHPRFSRLMDAVRRHVRRDDYQEFSRGEMGLESPAAIPHGKALDEDEELPGLRPAKAAPAIVAGRGLHELYRPDRIARPAGGAGVARRLPAGSWTLACAALVLALVVFVIAPLTATPEPEPSAPAGPTGVRLAPVPNGQLRIVTAEGACQVQRDDAVRAPARANEEVGERARVFTQADGRLSLLDGSGNSVVLAGDSSLEIAGSPATPGPGGSLFRFREPKGVLAFDFRAADAMTLEAGAAIVSVSKGVLRYTDSDRRPAVMLRSGSGSIVRVGRKPETLPPRRLVTLEDGPGAAPGKRP